MGLFRYLPMWTLHEILQAKYFMSPTPPSDEEIIKRFRQVGGVPRHIFLTDEAFARCLQNQNDAVRALALEQAQWISEGLWDAVGSFGSNQPKSALIGYALLPGKMRFSPRHVTCVSRSVAESIAERFVGDLWNLMLKKDHSLSSIFEDYCRRQMAQPTRSFRSRKYCEKNDEAFKVEDSVTLGGCSAIHMALDIAKAVTDGNPMTLYHSVDRNYPLIDFIYKDIDGNIHAFQPTVAKTHDYLPHKMRDLRATLGNAPLALYFLIPGDNFNQFVTNPTKPETDELTQIYHILIPNPNKESNHGSTPSVYN